MQKIVIPESIALQVKLEGPTSPTEHAQIDAFLTDWKAHKETKKQWSKYRSGSQSTGPIAVQPMTADQKRAATMRWVHENIYPSVFLEPERTWQIDGSQMGAGNASKQEMFRRLRRLVKHNAYVRKALEMAAERLAEGYYDVSVKNTSDAAKKVIIAWVERMAKPLRVAATIKACGQLALPKHAQSVEHDFSFVVQKDDEPEVQTNLLESPHFSGSYRDNSGWDKTVLVKDRSGNVVARTYKLPDHEPEASPQRLWAETCTFVKKAWHKASAFAIALMAYEWILKFDQIDTTGFVMVVKPPACVSDRKLGLGEVRTFNFYSKDFLACGTKFGNIWFCGECDVEVITAQVKKLRQKQGVDFGKQRLIAPPRAFVSSLQEQQRIVGQRVAALLATYN